MTSDYSPVTSEPISLLSARDEGFPPSLDLAARLYRPERPTSRPSGQQPDLFPGLVVGHGAGSRASRHHEFCSEAARHGFVVLAIDFRGHGSSGGDSDGPLEQDLLAGVAFLRDHPAVDPASIYYRGSSMGAFYGVKAASAAGFGAMVLLCPANEITMLRALGRDKTLDTREDTEKPDREKAGSGGSTLSETAGASDESARWDKIRLRAYFERQDILSSAGLVKCPVLLVHARDDLVVPFAHTLHLAEGLHGETTLLALPRGDHTAAQHDPRVHLLSLEWLRSKIPDKDAATPRSREDR